MEDLSDDHERAVESLQRFAALKRRQNVREVDLSFQEVKDLNLFEVRTRHTAGVSFQLLYSAVAFR